MNNISQDKSLKPENTKDYKKLKTKMEQNINNTEGNGIINKEISYHGENLDKYYKKIQDEEEMVLEKIEYEEYLNFNNSKNFVSQGPKTESNDIMKVSLKSQNDCQTLNAQEKDSNEKTIKKERNKKEVYYYLKKKLNEKIQKKYPRNSRKKYSIFVVDIFENPTNERNNNLVQNFTSLENPTNERIGNWASNSIRWGFLGLSITNTTSVSTNSELTDPNININYFNDVGIFDPLNIVDNPIQGDNATDDEEEALNASNLQALANVSTNHDDYNNFMRKYGNIIHIAFNHITYFSNKRRKLNYTIWNHPNRLSMYIKHYYY